MVTMDPIETITAIFDLLQSKVSVSVSTGVVTEADLLQMFDSAKTSVLNVAFSHQFIEYDVVTMSENILSD